MTARLDQSGWSDGLVINIRILELVHFQGLTLAALFSKKKAFTEICPQTSQAFWGFFVEVGHQC